VGILNSSLSNLLGGVSQQADSLRGASNCEEQTNAYPSPVNGLVKRPPTQFMTDALGANFQDANALDTASHLINRDSSERYLLTVSGKTLADGTGGGLSVWDLENNVAKTVYYDEDAIGYLNATDSTTAFSFATAGDVTYISNKEVTPKMESSTSPNVETEAMIHVRQGAYDTKYNVKLNGNEVTEETNVDGDNEAQTDTIAGKLQVLLNQTGSPTVALDETVALDYGNDITEGSNTFIGGYGVQWKAMRWTLSDAVSSALAAISPAVDLQNRSVTFNSIGTSSYNNELLTADYRLSYILTVTIQKDDVYYIHDYDSTNYDWIELKKTPAVDPTLYNVLSKKNGETYGFGRGNAALEINYNIPALNPTFQFTRRDSLIVATEFENNEFIISATDSVGDTYIKTFYKDTQYFSDLPAFAYNGFTIKIAGSAESQVDDYYVRFSTRDNESFGEGTWKEVVGFGIENTIDPSTMPHILIRQSDGTFLFKPADGKTIPDTVTSGYTQPTTTEVKYSGTVHAILSTTQALLTGLPVGTTLTAGTKIVLRNATDAEDETYYLAQDATFDSLGQAIITITGSPQNFETSDTYTTATVYEYADYGSFRWEDRKSGDNVTNPLPNFIGNTINDIFFYENRLGMLSGESVTLSESGQFFNFFRTTVIDLLDTAPIEVVGSSNSVNTLRHAVSFNGNLILFGDNTQFMLGSGREGLSPRTVAMSQVSNYECDPNCAPVIGGTSVFFAYPRGSYGGLQDMVIRDPEARDLQAFDLTDSVPSYIENPFRDIATMPQENLVIGLPKAEGGDMQDLYLYKYLDRGNERIQSAWFKFSLTSQGITADTQQIIGIHTVENTLYVLSRFVDADTPTNSHTSIHKIEFTTEGITDLFSQPPLLDNVLSRLGTDGVVTAAVVGDDTVFTLPYGSLGKTASDFQVITKHKTGSDGGVVLPILAVNVTAAESTTITVDTDKTAEHVWIGMKYDMTYKYASPIFKGPSSGGGASLVTSGRYQIHSADIVYHDTNTFNVAVSVEGRSDYSYTFTADTTQVDVTSEGSVGLDSGDMRIPIHAKNDTYSMTITSDSAYPVKLLSTEFEAQYNARSRRMGI